MNGISGLNAYYAFPGGGAYGGTYGVLAAARTAQVTGKTIPSVGAKKAAQPEAPVEQVRPVTPVRSEAPAQASRPVPTWNLNAADEAVRMRIQQPGSEGNASQPSAATGNTAERAWSLPGSGTAQQPAWPPGLPGTGSGDAAAGGAWANLPSYPGVDAGETAARLRIQYPGQDGENAAAAGTVDTDADPVGAEGVQKAAEEGKCETCEKRKYQDGSDDPGVSYQTPTRIAPENAASAVRGHEMEHVVREQAKAQREDRRVVSQSVTLHTDICPECGKAYISGGTTRTVTASNPSTPEPVQAQAEAQNTPAGLA